MQYCGSKEESLNIVYNMKVRIVLMKHGRRQVLKVRKENRLQNLRDVALTGKCTLNAYSGGAGVEYNTTPHYTTGIGQV